MSFPLRIVSISFAFLHRVAQCTLMVLFNFLHLTVCFSKDKVFLLSSMAIRVVEFSNRGYKIRKYLCT